MKFVWKNARHDKREEKNKWMNERAYNINLNSASFFVGTLRRSFPKSLLFSPHSDSSQRFLSTRLRYQTVCFSCKMYKFARSVAFFSHLHFPFSRPAILQLNMYSWLAFSKRKKHENYLHGVGAEIKRRKGFHWCFMSKFRSVILRDTFVFRELFCVFESSFHRGGLICFHGAIPSTICGTFEKPISASSVTCEIDVSVVNFLSTLVYLRCVMSCDLV